MRKKDYSSSREYFEEAEKDKFFWRIENPYISKLEKEILAPILKSKSKKTLEVGCGEGNNILLLLQEGFSGEIYGIDFSPERIKFAKTVCPKAKLSVDNALNPSFANNSFDLVFCRDVLHHIQDKREAIIQMLRVLKPQGKLFIIEQNEKNPIIYLWRCFNVWERSTPPSVHKTYTKILTKERSVGETTFSTRQALPVGRLLLHYKFGLPKLGSFRIAQFLLSVLEVVGRNILPEKYWSYLIFEIRKI